MPKLQLLFSCCETDEACFAASMCCCCCCSSYLAAARQASLLLSICNACRCCNFCSAAVRQKRSAATWLQSVSGTWLCSIPARRCPCCSNKVRCAAKAPVTTHRQSVDAWYGLVILCMASPLCECDAICTLPRFAWAHVCFLYNIEIATQPDDVGWVLFSTTSKRLAC